MKTIFDVLSEFGITIPEESKEAFEKSLNENYKTVAEVDKIKEKNQLLTEQLKTATESLDKFKEIDIGALNGQIDTLKNTLSEKDREYQEKIASMEFDTALDAAITGAKAKNNKAVRALLDIDALKSSQNRDADIASSLEKIKQENDYLFVSDEPIKNPTGYTGGTGAGGADPLAAIRAAMGLPAM